MPSIWMPSGFARNMCTLAGRRGRCRGRDPMMSSPMMASRLVRFARTFAGVIPADEHDVEVRRRCTWGTLSVSTEAGTPSPGSRCTRPVTFALRGGTVRAVEVALENPRRLPNAGNAQRGRLRLRLRRVARPSADDDGTGENAGESAHGNDGSVRGRVRTHTRDRRAIRYYAGYRPMFHPGALRPSPGVKRAGRPAPVYPPLPVAQPRGAPGFGL